MTSSSTLSPGTFGKGRYTSVMGIFGSIAGGTLGFILGGPIGAFFGSVMGSGMGEQAGSKRATTFKSSQAQAQAIFAVALTSLAAKVAKADGQVTQDEIDAYDAFLRDRMGMSVAERKFAAQVFNHARDNDTPASEFALQLGQLLRTQPDRLRDIITILFVVASADGVQHPAEEELIRRIARDMGLSSQDYQSCKANFNAVQGGPKVSPYEVLGVSTDASNADVRAAHRRIVREYHPDVLQSKGMPEEFMKFANEKLIAANEAWSQIKDQRGM
ncbi:MAG: DnaJ like chaperone protein [Planctomycetota bacterium]|jgi:DnaJ like chaperone protein